MRGSRYRPSRIYGNLQLQETASPKRRRSAVFVIGITILAALAAGLIWAGNTFTVREVRFESSGLLSAETLSLRTPKNAHLLVWSEDQFLTELRSHYPLSTFSARRILPSTVVIRVEDPELALMWQSNADCALVSVEGDVFDIRNAESCASLPDSVRKLPTVTDTLPLPSPGTRLVSGSYVGAVTEIQNLMKEVLPEEVGYSLIAGESSYDVRLLLADGTVFRLTVIGDIGVQLRNAKRLLEQAQNVRGTTVDMRVDGWAYVK